MFIKKKGNLRLTIYKTEIVRAWPVRDIVPDVLLKLFYGPELISGALYTYIDI